jgi:hypothetical protein
LHPPWRRRRRRRRRRRSIVVQHRGSVRRGTSSVLDILHIAEHLAAKVYALLQVAARDSISLDGICGPA